MARFETLTVNQLRAQDLYLGSANGGKGVEVATNKAYAAVMTVGTEAANVINVAIQLNDPSGTALALATGLKYYLSSDSAGQVLEASGPDAIAIGTDGVLIKSGGDSLIHGHVVSETDGDIDIDITHAGVDTFYLNLILPDGSLATSGAITFDATT